MNRRQAHRTRPDVTIRRRPSDFTGRGTVLLQGATCCCTCCCCLHWIGAAAGGMAGILGACAADKRKPDSPVRPLARRLVFWAAWMAVPAAAASLILVWFARDLDVDFPSLVWTTAILCAAALGGVAGIVSAWQTGESRPASPVHPVARAYVLRATLLGVFCTVALITLAAVVVANFSPSESLINLYHTDVIGFIVGVLVFVPSLALLPVGAAAMVGAALAKRIEGARTSDPNERQRISAGMGLAWRIAWVSFLLSGFLSGLGYLVMYVMALLMD